MNDTTIHLLGLNYRDGDREIQPGFCRVLENLYPSGTVPKLVWNPVPESALYYAGVTGTKINAASEWQRNNLPPLLVYLRIVPSGNDIIGARQLDSSGNIIPDVAEIVLHTFTGSNSNRDAQFAQIGDNLLIAVLVSGNAEDLLVASVYENTTICFPFNIPFSTPEIDITPTDGENHKCFGFRFAYELHDGTLTRMSNVRLRRFDYSSPEGKTISFSTARLVPAGFEEYKKIIRGIAIFMSNPEPGPFSVLHKSIWHRIGMISWNTFDDAILDEEVTIADGGNSYVTGDILDVDDGASGTGAKVYVNVALGGVLTTLTWVARGKNYATGTANLTGGSGSGGQITIGSVGSGGNTFEFLLQDTEASPLLADLATYPQLDEDILTSHSIYATVLGSYNRAALLGQAEYEFVRPQTTLQPATTPLGKTRPEATSITYTPPLITNETFRINRVCHLTWVKPASATGVTIEMYFFGTRDGYFPPPFDEWKEVQPPINMDWQRLHTDISGTTKDITVQIQMDVPDQANPTILRYKSHFLRFRIRAEYADGVPSDWVYYTPSQGGG